VQQTFIARKMVEKKSFLRLNSHHQLFCESDRKEKIPQQQDSQELYRSVHLSKIHLEGKDIKSLSKAQNTQI
jgi:hypothetical protein